MSAPSIEDADMQITPPTPDPEGEANVDTDAGDRALAFLPLKKAQSEGSLSGLATQSMIQAQRSLLRWSRDPFTTVQVLLYPALMLVMFKIVLGNSIAAATGTSAIYGQVAMMTLVASMVGSMAGAVTLQIEKQQGLLTRFWVLPVHRASSLVGRLIAEAVRIMITTVAIILVGFALGFRFHNGVLPAIGMFLVPLLFGLGFATIVTAAAVYGGKTRLVEIISLATSLLMFFNSGFVPVLAYPTWLQGFVQYQPMSCAVQTMSSLATGSPMGDNLWLTVAWSLGLVALFIYPAVRGYQRAAEPGRE